MVHHRVGRSHIDYLGLIQTIPSLIVVADREDVIWFSNRGWDVFTGLDASTIDGTSWIDAIHPLDIHKIGNARARALAGDGGTDLAARLQARDGNFRNLHFHVAPFDLASGDRGWCLIGMHGCPFKAAETELDSKSDMSASETKRHGELAELRRITAQFREGQRLSSTGSFTSDLQRDENRWSEEFYRIFEIDADAPPIVERVRERVHPDDLALFDSEIERGRTGHNGDFDFRVITPKGGLRYIRGIARMIYNLDGRPIFMGIAQDVTESRLSEMALRKREGELRQANYHLSVAQELSKTGIFVWNLSSDESRWSDEMYRIFDATPSSTPWAEALELVHPMDRPSVGSMISRARSGQDFQGEFRLIMRDGTTKNIKTVGRLLADEAEKTFVGAVQDITEARQQEEALNRVRADLAHVARVSALGTLSASIAHQVSQPLAGILNNSNACLRMLSADNPNLEKALETVRRSLRDATRAAEVVRRLRALFIRSALTVEAVDLNEAAREVGAILCGEFWRGLVLLDLRLDETIPKVRGDRIQLQQVILNLLLNALDAVSSAGGDERRVRAETKFNDGCVTLSVSDTGTGLGTDPEKLFDAFHTTKDNRMGIGLSVSRAIVESMGGEIGAKQNEDRGATFYFSIPRYAD